MKMKSDISKQRYNIVFIGSGISTSFSLLSFLDQIKDADITRELKIIILDKWDEFNKGLPYGDRSGASVLLITSLRNFLPEPELTPFIKWLNQHKEELLTEFMESGGELSRNWIENHRLEIEQNQWEELFIPRFFFGHYIDQKVSRRIEETKKIRPLSVEFRQAKAVDLHKNDEFWTVELKGGGVLETEKVVLSVGSLPMRYLWKESRVVKDDELLFINDIYTKSLQRTLYDIEKFLDKKQDQKVNVAIIGANASALEMLYKLNDVDRISARVEKFTFVSTYGVLPDSEAAPEKQKLFQPANLQALQNKAKLKASDISDAAFKDLKIADKLDLGAFSTVNIISSAFGQLLGSLSDQELKNFACYYGNEIGRFQRCAGQHYTNTIKTLKEDGRFEHKAGRFLKVDKIDNGPYLLEYEDTETEEIHRLADPVQIVINCTGSMNLYSSKIPKLIRNILKKEYVQPNDSKIGFDVNDYLEADKNLHIIGPLLAGNVIRKLPVWHVEHCGRIIWLSGVLGEILHNSYSYENKKQDLRILVRDLNTSEDQKKYTALLTEHWNSYPYASLPYLTHHLAEGDRPIAFELYKGTQILAMMPMILRQIPDQVNQQVYYDVISPYGYSGPMFVENLDNIYLYAFWDMVDKWYVENKVVTEFIRFSLNGNHQYYSGRLELTLNNVVGTIHPELQTNWDGFLSKVRNNYRKATTHDLKFEIYKGHDIGENEIDAFHEIYIETMDRNKAANKYFYKSEFFADLIYGLPEKFVLAFTSKDGQKASTELLILHNGQLFAFLGGTRQNYFNCRPNDFLRVEIIQWASTNNIKKYILGGGRADDDGLYKHKKSLFPRDQDIMYYTGRKVVLKEINEKLNAIRLKDVQVEYETVRKDYFPKYRF